MHCCAKSKTGKKELLELLEKGGIRQCDNILKRLQQQIWFANELVGRNASEPEATMTQEVCEHV